MPSASSCSPIGRTLPPAAFCARSGSPTTRPMTCSRWTSDAWARRRAPRFRGGGFHGVEQAGRADVLAAAPAGERPADARAPQGRPSCTRGGRGRVGCACRGVLRAARRRGPAPARPHGDHALALGPHVRHAPRARPHRRVPASCSLRRALRWPIPPPSWRSSGARSISPASTPRPESWSPCPTWCSTASSSSISGA